MDRRTANPTTMTTRFSRGVSVCAGVWFSIVPAGLAQGAPGIEFQPGQTVELAAEPGALTTFAAAFPPIGATPAIRYQVDVEWLTSETPSSGFTHDSLFFSLQSADGSQTAPLFGVDVFGLHPEAVDGFSLHVEPLASSGSPSENSLAYRVYISAPAAFFEDGSWAVIDLADTGELGGSRALVLVGSVPEPGMLSLIGVGGVLLGWRLHRMAGGGRR